MFKIEGNEKNEKWAHEILVDVVQTFYRASADIRTRTSTIELDALRCFETAIRWVCEQGAGFVIENRANLETYSKFQSFIERNKGTLQLYDFDFKFAYGRFINKYEIVN